MVWLCLKLLRLLCRAKPLLFLFFLCFSYGSASQYTSTLLEPVIMLLFMIFPYAQTFLWCRLVLLSKSLIFKQVTESAKSIPVNFRLGLWEVSATLTGVGLTGVGVGVGL